MADTNHYQTLGVSPRATQAEIKTAYRQLAKQFHPDSHSGQADHQQIVRINAAYEVLGDRQRRQAYDQSAGFGRHTSNPRTQGQTYQEWQAETGRAPTSHHSTSHRSTSHHATTAQAQQQRHAARATDEAIDDWERQVFNPANRLINRILTPLKSEIDALSADPFDDDLMEAFQNYLGESRRLHEQAQQTFRSARNPSPAAGVAANLYYCLNSLSDGLDELRRFSYTYDETYLSSGKEMFRVATRMRKDAQAAMKKLRG